MIHCRSFTRYLALFSIRVLAYLLRKLKDPLVLAEMFLIIRILLNQELSPLLQFMALQECLQDRFLANNLQSLPIETFSKQKFSLVQIDEQFET